MQRFFSAASQNRDRTKYRLRNDPGSAAHRFAKSYALRCVRGTQRSYCFNVSRNRTGSPLDGVTSSPCHITRRPRTNVPTGQPVTRTPS